MHKAGGLGRGDDAMHLHEVGQGQGSGMLKSCPVAAILPAQDARFGGSGARALADVHTQCFRRFLFVGLALLPAARLGEAVTRRAVSCRP